MLAPCLTPPLSQRAANPWGSILNQLAALRPIEPRPPRYNPRWPDLMVSGSATDVVLQVLLASAGRFLRVRAEVARLNEGAS